MRILSLCSFFLLCLSFIRVDAQVVINEYSAANLRQFSDDHNDYEDWIELYNKGAATADVSGFYISDDPAEPKKFKFPAGTTIEADSFLIVWCSGRNLSVNNSYHAGFKLTQSKSNPEDLVFSNASGALLQTVGLEKTALNQSRCRSIDGGNNWRISTTPTPGATNNFAQQYKSICSRPDVEPVAGFYSGSIEVTIDSNDPEQETHYTLDGTEPTLLSPIYSGPITIFQTTVVKAKNFSADPEILPGFVRFNTYLINESFTLQVFSVAADSVQDLANGAREIRPIGSIEVFGTDGLRKTTSYGELNSHGQDSWVNDQRSLDWVSRDEMGYSKAIKQKLFDYSERDEYQRIIFRAAGDDNYPATPAPEHRGSCHLRDDYVQSLAKLGGLQLDERTSDRCILFLNGEYWGVYSIREIPDDHDYTDYYYGQGKYDIQYLLTWGNTWSEYGGEVAKEEWNEMRRFILDNDMSDPDNYQKVQDSIDLLSMIDYFLVNLNVVASDWLNYNTGWWRGRNPDGEHKKWGYILWDLDATFSYYINYSGVPDITYKAELCDLEAISDYVQGDFFSGAFEDTCITYGEPPDTFQYCFRVDGKHQLILLKLIQENQQFREYYYSRQADLVNTVFSCENMLHVLDSMVQVIEPEMQRHIARWGGTKTKWESNVQKMRTFITNRCGYFDNALLSCYGELNGPYQVTLMVDPPGAGVVQLNTLDHTQFPWTGDYYGGMTNYVKAKPTSFLPFHHWETRSGTIINPDLTIPEGSFELTNADTLVAVFGFPTGSHDAEGNLALSVYPTLVTNGSVNVSYQLRESLPVQITLYTVLGQPVATWHEKSGMQNDIKLDLNEKQLAPGVYQLELVAGFYRKTVKLMVE